jgi:hypothetical protein
MADEGEKGKKPLTFAGMYFIEEELQSQFYQVLR